MSALDGLRDALARQASKSLSQKDRTRLAGIPVFAALWIYALAHNRWWLATPLALALLGCVAFGVSFERRPWHLLAAGIGGALFGALMMLQGYPPVSALPPGFMDPMCGALAALACLCVVSSRWVYAWIFAWILVALCLHVPPGTSFVLPFICIAAGSAGVTAALTNGGRWSARNYVGWATSLMIAGAVMFGLAFFALRAERVVTAAGERYLNSDRAATGIGLDSTLSLRQTASIDESDRPVLELDGAPPAYLRTHVMDDFDGLHWATRATNERTVATTSPEVQGEATRKLSVIFIEPLETVIPAPSGTIAVHGSPVRELPTWVWRAAKSPPRSELEIDRTAADVLPQERAPVAADVALPTVGDLGPLRDRFRPLALDIVKDAKTPREMAERIEHFFRSEFYYSLHTDLRGKGHPLEVLIREKRPTFCTYFASAMVVLLRSLDVPARVVTGFAPFETNPVDGKTLVRMLDAHAWVEAYLPDAGRYVRFDPTSSNWRDAGPQRAQPGWFGGSFRAIGSAFRRGWFTFRDDPFGTIARLARSPFVAVPAIAFVLWQFWRLRGGGPGLVRAALQSNDKRLRETYRRYLRALDRAGVAASNSDTDGELLAKFAALRPEAGKAAHAFVGAYQAIRYGNESPGDLSALLKAVEKFASQPSRLS